MVARVLSAEIDASMAGVLGVSHLLIYERRRCKAT